MNVKRLESSLMLTLTAMIWGVAFVAQSVGLEYLGPFTFNTVRSLLGGLVLLPCIVLLDRWQGCNKRKATPAEQRVLLEGGIVCGLVLAVASSLQQIGLQYTTVGKAGFLTALYIILVPVFGLFMGKKVRRLIWVAVAFAILGLYFLCINGKFSISRGDLLVFICAFCFATHILVIDHYSPRVDGVRMSCIQFFVTGIVCAVPMLLFETVSLHAILAGWVPVLYAGVMSCGVAYTLQIVGQKNLDPTVASLIMSLESVISVIAGWLILGQRMSAREILGCALVFCGIILAQLPVRKAASVKGG